MDTPYANLNDLGNLTNAVVQLGRDAAVLAECNPQLLDAVSIFDLNGRPLDILAACDMVNAELQRIKLRVNGHRDVTHQMRLASETTIEPK